MHYAWQLHGTDDRHESIVGGILEKDFAAAAKIELRGRVGISPLLRSSTQWGVHLMLRTILYTTGIRPHGHFWLKTSVRLISGGSSLYYGQAYRSRLGQAGVPPTGSSW